MTGNTPPPPNLLPSPNWSIPNNINFVHSCPLHSPPQSLPCCAAQKILFIAVSDETYHGLHWCSWLPVYPCAQCSGCVGTQKHKPTAGGDNTWQTWRQIVMVNILLSFIFQNVSSTSYDGSKLFQLTSIMVWYNCVSENFLNFKSLSKRDSAHITQKHTRARQWDFSILRKHKSRKSFFFNDLNVLLLK